MLCWGLTTRKHLWAILCRLPEKGRKKIEEMVEELKEKRDRRDGRRDEREGQRRKRNGNESEETEKINIAPLPLPATKIAGLAQLSSNISWTPR